MLDRVVGSTKGLEAAPADSAIDYVSPGGARAVVVKEGLRGARDLRAAVFETAALLLERGSIREVCLTIEIRRISPDRLLAEWNRARAIVRPGIGERMRLVGLVQGSVVVDAVRPWTQKIAERLKSAVIAPDAARATSRSMPSAKSVEVLKVLMNRWLRGQGSVTARELQRICGCSYPTVSDALSRLRQSKEIVREPDRSVRFVEFPRKSWDELLILSVPLRRPVRFGDASGRPSDPQDLLKRLCKMHPAHVAVGGVIAARRWDPQFDLHGTPRLDLSVHAPGGDVDFGFIRRLDAALHELPPASEGGSLVVHPLVRSDPLFDGGMKKRGLPWADPVETLLDLHEMRLIDQAESLVRRLRRKASR